MDFAKITAEELLEALPPTEDDKWELKSASLLSATKGNEFKNELAKQVSAFSNTGGGYLVFGVSDRNRQLEPCEKVVGRTSMKDVLSRLVEQSVDQAIQSYRVHPVRFKDNPDQNIYVVEVEDSPAAPHQAKSERVYYYRLDGHSVRAPHFHLELLRSRFTKTTLRIAGITHEIQKCRHRSAQQTTSLRRRSVRTKSDGACGLPER